MAIKKSKSMDKMPARKMPEGVKFPKNNKAVPNPPSTAKFRTATKAAAKAPAKKAAPLKGPAAIAELQRQVSPSGMKKSEANVKKANDKKYPGLYKKSK